MREAAAWGRTAKVVGGLVLAAGVAVFAIRLQHPGPYAFPEQGNLRAGLLALGVGAALLALGRRRGPGQAGSIAALLLVVASPVVLFFALYSVLAELEETVTLRATDSSGAPANLRLWIVDAEGSAWVSMPRSKAEEHSLDGAKLELLREGETRCVVPVLSKDPAENERTFQLRDRKYSVQRLGRLIGMFGDGPGPETVTLRLDPCRGPRAG